jgi:mannose-1-phosphate guanylyltransferase
MMGVCRQPKPAVEKSSDYEGPPHAWGVVLAGGKGMRLRELTRHLYGEDRPKQYAVLTGLKSLLRQTLDRVSLLIPPGRTIVVTMAGQSLHVGGAAPRVASASCPWSSPRIAGPRRPSCWRPPDHGSGSPAILVALPSDHFVADDEVFVEHVAGSSPFSASERIVLLGAGRARPRRTMAG